MFSHDKFVSHPRRSCTRSWLTMISVFICMNYWRWETLHFLVTFSRIMHLVFSPPIWFFMFHVYTHWPGPGLLSQHGHHAPWRQAPQCDDRPPVEKGRQCPPNDTPVRARLDVGDHISTMRWLALHFCCLWSSQSPGLFSWASFRPWLVKEHTSTRL